MRVRGVHLNIRIDSRDTSTSVEHGKRKALLDKDRHATCINATEGKTLMARITSRPSPAVC